MNWRVSASAQNQTYVNFQRVKMEPFFRRKDKAVFVVGPTGTGKSRLAIDIATRAPAEIINCDKMQVYKGLNIVTNKVNSDETRGVPHHLLGFVADPNSDFNSDDFRYHALNTLNLISSRDRLPIIAGGSNSFIEALVTDDREFRLKYECCFLWVDVSLPVLYSFVSDRVDRMVNSGLINEVRDLFEPKIRNYSKGIRRAIGVPELDRYLRCEGIVDERTRGSILEEAISKIKENTCTLASKQRKKIQRWKWKMHRIDATEVFMKSGEEAEEAWDKLVAGPSVRIVEEFLYGGDDHILSPETVTVMTASDLLIPVPAMASW